MDKVDNDEGGTKPDKGQESPTRTELIEQLEAYVNNLEKLPPHEQFSFALLCDVYYPLLIILAILKKGP
jgi:hypothetical protein